MLRIASLARPGGVVLAAFLVTSLLASPADARRKRRGKAKGRVVALFYVAKDKPNQKLFGTLVRDLTRADKQVPDLRLLYGGKLKRAIRKKPEVAIAKCGSNVKCIAKLGRKARAKEVVYARVSPSSGGIKAQFLVVDVAGRSITRRVEMEVDSVNALTAVLPAKVDEMFGVAAKIADAGGGGGDELSLDMVLDDAGDGDELPLEVATAVPPPPPDEGGGDELALADAGIDDGPADDSGGSDAGAAGELPLDFGAMDGPADESATPDDMGSDGPPPFDEGNATEIAALDADMSSGATATAEVSDDDGGGVGALTYAGIGAAGLGAVGLGLGGLFGAQASSKRDTIEYGPGGTTQIEARTINKDANALASRANLMFGIGGGLLVVGGALIAVDMMTGGDSSSPSTSVTVGEGSAYLELGWTF